MLKKRKCSGWFHPEHFVLPTNAITLNRYYVIIALTAGAVRGNALSLPSSYLSFIFHLQIKGIHQSQNNYHGFQ